MKIGIVVEKRTKKPTLQGLNLKRYKREKKKYFMKKYKTSCKTAEGGKTYGVDSSGRLDTRFYS